MDRARRLFLTVMPEDGGKTVGTILRRRLCLSAGAVRRVKYLEDGITLDGQSVYTNAVVAPGQQLSVQIGDPGPAGTITPVSGALDIAYEDEDILIVNKPANLSVHPGPGEPRDTLANYVLHYYQRIGLVAGFHPANRLDRGTSGLMSIAKHAHAHDRLIAAMGTGSLIREYLAVCSGSPDPSVGRLDFPIGRCDDSPIRREVRPDGAVAVTHYRILFSDGARSLLAIRLETGRTHQIRVHFSHIGCPLVGDFLYGTELPELPGRFALHAAKLSLKHPISGKDVFAAAPLPASLQALLQADKAVLSPILEAFCERTQ